MLVPLYMYVDGGQKNKTKAATFLVVHDDVVMWMIKRIRSMRNLRAEKQMRLRCEILGATM